MHQFTVNMARVTLLLLISVSQIFSVYVPGTPGGPWTKDEVLAVKAKLRYSFAKPWGMARQANTALGTTDPGDNGGGYNAAKVLRLTFHDCLLYTDGTGGCDGCLNWEGVGKVFQDAANKNLYPDVKFTDNNGLRNTVEILEAIYQVPTFPNTAQTLSTSLKDSGKSRADLWALAGIVAVEYGIETNNLKCADASSVGGCHHLQGETGCSVVMDKSIPFRTGRADCIPSDSTRPYITNKHEAHPNAVGDGSETIQFFKDNFNFSGQETVAIMGAHTMGRFNYGTSLFRYVWTSRGWDFFNNDYYKMITDETRWFFDDDDCTKVGDAYNNKPARRWMALYRGDTFNNGPVHWISENYVCPNCKKASAPCNQAIRDQCCTNVPEGNFCVPDSVNMTMKTPLQLAQSWLHCETFRFICGIDEMALPCEIGLYFEFQNRGNGFPTGCPGLDNFDGQNGQIWSNINGIPADPQCPLQSKAVPSDDHSTSWYMKEYARDQDRFIRDFVAAFDKMLSNGYSSLTAGPDQTTGVKCTDQLIARKNGFFSQCYEPGVLSEAQFAIISQLDGKAVELNTNGNIEMRTQDTSNSRQKWMLQTNPDGVSGQIVNVATNQVLLVAGIADWEIGEENSQGYYTIHGARGSIYDTNKMQPNAWDRGWSKDEGKRVGVWNRHGAANQRFKIVPLDM